MTASASSSTAGSPIFGIMKRPHHAAPEIADEDGESHVVIGGHADAGLVLLCDHAGNRLPPGYGTLGLAADQLGRHIAYDIGAAAITRRLAEALGAPAVMTKFSRLLIDPNRGADDPTLIMRLSDGAVIPGNRHLDDAEREHRMRLYYRPYHAAIDRVIDACEARGPAPTLLSIHSFTESWKGAPRPWHVGVLWASDGRLAEPLLAGFHAERELIVGDNQPYAGQLEGDCLWQHGTGRGLAHAIIEYRQDLVRDAAGQTRWAELTARIVRGIVTDRGGAPRRPTDTAIPTGDALMSTKPKIVVDAATETELEAAAYRRLVAHLRERTEVQNIDLMNLAGFCRNCLANWYQEAAAAKGIALTKDDAREIVYGMPYKDWQAAHQASATPAQQAAFDKSKPHRH